MFSGIGGFELGIQRAHSGLVNKNGQMDTLSERQETQHSNGISDSRAERNTLNITNSPQATCIGYSEIDKYAIKVYERHFNGHKNYGDATKINATELPDFDLLVGGFPCQAFSVAGKRAGFNDTRGTLFFDIARILSEKRPRHLVLENVKGLLSHDSGKTFQTILGVLSDLGYRVEWQVLNSKDFGVPQNRERIIIIGHLRDECGRKVLPITGTNTEDTRIIGQDVAYTIDANYHKGTNTLEKSRRSIVQVNQPVHSNDRVYSDEGISPTLNTMQGGNRQPFVKVREATKKGYAEATVGDTLNISVPTSKTRRGRVQKKLAGTLQTSESMATLTPDARIRRLTPKECERLQGFPDDWTKYGVNDELISDTQRYKMCGNAVTTNVIQAVMERLLDEQ